MNVEYPLLFRLENKATGRFTHCGVLEFTADEGRCYIPHWMMENLFLQESGILEVTYHPLRKATFIKVLLFGRFQYPLTRHDCLVPPTKC